ncbi:hypothetical protein EDC04DRAFT_2652689, partial [Pisolithus marmoratus]
MAPYYRVLTSSSEIDVDPELTESIREGESEISDALKARANHLTRIGDKRNHQVLGRG